MNAALPSDVAIYDTTLRDGTQREGISLACSDKLRIAQQLDALGIAFIEGGWPGSNPKDAELFRRARDVEWSTATLAAFGATRRAGVEVDADPSLIALVASGAKLCTIFGKTSVLHVREVLRTSLDENLAMIEDSVRWLGSFGLRVIYDAEHFFDGAREDEVYALETLHAAARGGAEAIVLCDTNGGAFPWDVERRVRELVASLPVAIGIHAHDDGGCGVANTIAAVRAGATHVQGTINGYGERCGNANLTTIIPNLELKLGVRCIRPGALAELGRVARVVADTANLAFDEHAPYFGRSAFAHKGGVHVAAIERCPHAYEHVDPALVGNRTRFVVSELSGRANVRALAEEFAVTAEDAGHVLARVKEREALGFSFEAAEASVALMMRRADSAYVPLFELVDYKVLSALDAALRKALVPSYPELATIQLEDYKVRIIDGRDGTSATTRVLVDHGNGRERWSTVGASPSILEASLVALVDGVEHGLWITQSRSSTKGDQDAGHDRIAAR
jgi:2-isopropylmalate synthase